MSKKSKLTPEVQEQICALIMGGHYPSTAARASGINPSTFASWITQGKKAKSGKFRELFDAIEEAEAQSEMILMKKVLDGGPKSALQILKRRFRDRWGDKLGVEQSGPGGAPIQTEVSGPGGAPIQVLIGDQSHVWSSQEFGEIQEATEDDLPEKT